MPLFLDSGRLGSDVALNAGNCITVGLVNNMPDAAVEATERQFTELLRAAAPKAVVVLKLFSHPDSTARRGDAAGIRRTLSRHCRTVGYAARRTDRDRDRAARQKSRGRAVLGDPNQGGGLGARQHRVGDLVVPCRARRRSACRRYRAPRPERKAGSVFSTASSSPTTRCCRIFRCRSACRIPATTTCRSGR